MNNFARSIANIAASATIWFVLMSIAGFSFIVAAVFVLAGIGWALLACGFAFLLFAGFLMRGLANG